MKQKFMQKPEVHRTDSGRTGYEVKGIGESLAWLPGLSCEPVTKWVSGMINRDGKYT